MGNANCQCGIFLHNDVITSSKLQLTTGHKICRLSYLAIGKYQIFSESI